MKAAQWITLLLAAALANGCPAQNAVLNWLQDIPVATTRFSSPEMGLQCRIPQGDMYRYVLDALNKIPTPDSLPQYGYLRSYLFHRFGRYDQEKYRYVAFTEWCAVGKRILPNGGILGAFWSVPLICEEYDARYATDDVLLVYFKPSGEVGGALFFSIYKFGRYASVSHTLTELSDGTFRLNYEFSAGDDNGNYSEGSIDYYFRLDTNLCAFVEARLPAPRAFNGQYRNPATGERLSISTPSVSEEFRSSLLQIGYKHKQSPLVELSPKFADPKAGVIDVVIPGSNLISRLVFSPSHTQFTAYREDGSPPQVWLGSSGRLW